MVDIGHRKTDEALERLEKRLAKEYAQAYKEVEKKAADYFARFAGKDKRKKALVDSGKLSEKEYQTWRKNQMLTGKRWTDLRDQLAKDLTNTNQIAAGIVRGELNDVFAINANYSEYLIENGMRTNYGFTLYSRESIANLVANDPDIIPWKPEVDVPADLRWNRQMITSHITQGILQGESIPNLSKRLLKTVNNDKVAAVRTARTAVTSAQNAGRQMVYDRAKKMGLKLQKEWLATLDARTRHEHGAVDGQRVPLDGKFDVGGYKMKYPGDMSAPAHLVYNCRCTTITVEPDYIIKGEEPRMTYSEWVETKEGKDNQAKNVQKAKPTNKDGKEIVFSEKMRNGEWEENIKIITGLSKKYKTKLIDVGLGSHKSAGSVQISGSVMRLSSKSVDTTIHEFAHTISTENQTKFGLYDEKDFWKEIRSVQRKYKKAVSEDTKKWISSYEHSSEGADEFMAEAFTHAQMKEMGLKLPDKYGEDFTYSEMVLEIIKKYFGRGK